MKKYLFNILLSLTQLLNALLLGDPDESLSSRCAKKHPRAAQLIDRLFWFDPRHCERSLEPEEGGHGLTAGERLQVLIAAAIIVLLLVLF